MTGWIILGVYLLGFFMTWRRTSWYIISDITSDPDGSDLAFGACIGAMFNTLWPLIYICALIGWVYRRQYALHGDAFHRMLMPRSMRKAAELKARDERIKQLERELGYSK